MSIHNYTRKAFKHELKKDFEEDKYLPKTVDGLLEYLFDQDVRYKGYHVYLDKEAYSARSNTTQRLNRLWVVPIWFVIAPFKWLATGSAGVNQHTKLGKWLAKITGL